MHYPTVCDSCSLYNAQRSITEALRDVMEAFRIVMGCYGMLQSIARCYGTQGSIAEALQATAECYGTIRSVADITERYRSVTKLLW